MGLQVERVNELTRVQKNGPVRVKLTTLLPGLEEVLRAIQGLPRPDRDGDAGASVEAVPHLPRH